MKSCGWAFFWMKVRLQEQGRPRGRRGCTADARQLMAKKRKKGKIDDE